MKDKSISKDVRIAIAIARNAALGSASDGGLRKTGSGTLTLAGNNTYTGGTTINGGTLRANHAANSTGSGAVAVNSGGTLGGSGTIANGSNAVTVNTGGTITAGDSGTATGTLTTGKQKWNAGGSYAWKLNSAAQTTPGTTASWDLLTMSTLDLTGLSSASPFTIKASKLGSALGGLTIGKTFLIADLPNAGAVSLPPGESIANLFVLDASGLVAGSSYSPPNFELSFGGGDISIVYTAAPEPGTVVLGGLALLPVLMRRRKRVTASIEHRSTYRLHV